MLSRTILLIVLLTGTSWLLAAADNVLNDDRFKRAQNRTYRGFEKENTTVDPDFTFIQAADPQFGLIEMIKTNRSDGGWKEDLRLTENAIKDWNSMKPKPKFVVICGDLANQFPYFNDTKAMERRRQQLDDLKKTLRKLDSKIPLILLSGNHDILDVPTEQTIQNYTNEFGDDYYSFWYGGAMFVVLNSQLYKNHSLVSGLYDKQDKWIDQQLTIAKARNFSHVIVFQHIPWFLNDITEPVNKYFTIEVEERQRMVDKLYNAKVRFIFSGHYHRNALGKYRNLTMITTSALGAQLGAQKPGYGVVRVRPNKIDYEYRNTRNGSSPTLTTNWNFLTFVSLFGLIWCGFRKI